MYKSDQQIIKEFDKEFSDRISWENRGSRMAEELKKDLKIWFIQKIENLRHSDKEAIDEAYKRGYADGKNGQPFGINNPIIKDLFNL